MKKTIKSLQFWYMADVAGPGDTTVRAELIAQRGQEVDITDDYDLKRGEEQDAFMSKDEIAAYQAEGTPYDPATAAEMATQQAPPPAGELDWANASVDDMADYMEEHQLTVNAVLEVANSHPERIDDILEAEGIVTEDEPRKGVVEGLQKIAARASE